MVGDLESQVLRVRGDGGRNVIEFDMSDPGGIVVVGDGKTFGPFASPAAVIDLKTFGGNDVIRGDADADAAFPANGIFEGGKGNDQFLDFGGKNTVAVYGGPGDDRVENAFGVVFGGGGDDTIIGTALADYVLGGSGNDLVKGKGGTDHVLGGKGRDTLVGGGGAFDSLFGQAGDDLLKGGSGDDIIYGEAGRDKIRGGPGDDTCFGGIDADDIIAGDSKNDFVGQDPASNEASSILSQINSIMQTVNLKGDSIDALDLID